MKSYANSESGQRALWWALAAVSFSIGLLCLRWLAGGFDLTDEGFYLNWISNPWIYPASGSQFGFIYHFFYKAVVGNVYAFRVVGMLLSLALAGALLFEVLRDKKLVGVAAPFVLTSLILFGLWMPTPGYNTLNLQGLLVAILAFFYSASEKRWKTLAGPWLLGLGGYLCFMAKPTTAAILSLVGLLYLWACPRFFLWQIFLSAVVSAALLGITAYIFDGSLTAYLERLKMGVEDVRILLGNLSFLQEVPQLNFHQNEIIALLVIFALSSLLLWAATLKKRRVDFLLWIFSFVVLTASMIFLWIPSLNVFPRSRLVGYMLLMPVLAQALLSLLARPKSRDGKFRATILALSPFIFSFGTAANFFASMLGASVFWLFFGVVIARKLDEREKALGIVLFLAIAQFLLILLLKSAIHAPYRQEGALYTFREKASIGSGHLFVNRETQKYLRELRALAQKGGFTPGDPFIDLTGHFPGASYVLEGRSVGAPWWIGGQTGSNAFAERALARVDCADVATAWLLMEQNGRRVLDTEILKTAGAKWPQDYELVGSLKSPKVGYSRSYLQHLYKARRSVNNGQRACEKARSSK